MIDPSGLNAYSHQLISPDQSSLHRTTRARREGTKASKKKSKSPKVTFKHGLEVPRRWKDVIRIDSEAGNRRWQEAI